MSKRIEVYKESLKRKVTRQRKGGTLGFGKQEHDDKKGVERQEGLEKEDQMKDTSFDEERREKTTGMEMEKKVRFGYQQHQNMNKS